MVVEVDAAISPQGPCRCLAAGTGYAGGIVWLPPAVPPPPASVASLINSPAIWQAGRGPLSLALMDARNHTLQLLGCFETAIREGVEMPRMAELEPPARIAGQVAWHAEWWTSRNPRLGLGTGLLSDSDRLPSIHPQADAWFGPGGRGPWPDLEVVRAFMLDQLEGTLELLERSDESDDALQLFRAMLFHEDLRGEQLVSQAQALGLRLPFEPAPALAPRPALHLQAMRWVLGAEAEGFAPSMDRPNQPAEVPEFEIDAQPVTWSQFIEFVDDGGYDRPELWHPQGWAWLQRVAVTEGRRGPRHVEQIGVSSGAVIQAWFGRPIRLSGMQPVVHATWWEADAWARWAQRRLPTEAEWEIAAHHAASRGFRWGSVLEWTAGSLNAWPGYLPDPWLVGTPFDPPPHWGKAKVQRGGSIAMRPRMKRVRTRRFSRPDDDLAFTGFRTCAV